ncbi:hypothetical protein [Peptoniphilus harei]|uniref:hypothetical protein n=1 Tax=Peptoniphilus harei TaxID=54005 RepID=UPI0011DD7D1F|nr:hypothetical protein [Peptoniphilus harei]
MFKNLNCDLIKNEENKVIFERINSVNEVIKILNENNINEIIITETSSDLFEKLEIFQEAGFKLSGITNFDCGERTFNWEEKTEEIVYQRGMLLIK